MQKKVDFVAEDASVQEVARLIFGHHINGVPVCRNKKVVGFITEKDILDSFYPTLQEFIEDPVHEGDFEHMEAKAGEILKTSVHEIMSTNPVKISADTPLLRAYSTMDIHRIGRLPVVDKQDNLIGILAKGDIFRAIVGRKVIEPHQ